jgi:hypothetical protein
MTYRERLPGGEASGLRPEDFDQVELERGTKHELEHTDDPEIAREIAMDHLAEDEAYYERLEALERQTFRNQSRPVTMGAMPLRDKLDEGDMLLENQLGGAGTALLVGAAALLAYFLFLRPARAAPAPAPGPAPTPTTCAIDPQRLDQWGAARGFPVVYAPQRMDAPTFDELADLLREKYPGIEDIADIEAKQFVAVIRDGSFWFYQIAQDGETVQTGRADNLRADYCAFTAAQPALPAPATCTVQTTEDLQRLNDWANANKIGALYLPSTREPPSGADIVESTFAEVLRNMQRSGARFVVVTSDGNFWDYGVTSPGITPSSITRRDDLRASYCAFRPQSAVAGVVHWL